MQTVLLADKFFACSASQMNTISSWIYVQSGGDKKGGKGREEKEPNYSDIGIIFPALILNVSVGQMCSWCK